MLWQSWRMNFLLLFRVPIRLTVNVCIADSRILWLRVIEIILNVVELYRLFTTCIIIYVITHGVFFDRSNTVFLFIIPKPSGLLRDHHIVHVRFPLSYKRPSR